MNQDGLESLQDQCQRLLMVLTENQKRIDTMERDLSLTRVSIDNVSRRVPPEGEQQTSGRQNISAPHTSKQTQSQKSSGPRYWTPVEHSRFVEALEKYGRKDVKSIAKYVDTRNATQVRTHAQKYFLRMKKEDPEQYARYVDDDDADDMQQQGIKRKAMSLTQDAYHTPHGEAPSQLTNPVLLGMVQPAVFPGSVVPIQGGVKPEVADEN